VTVPHSERGEGYSSAAVQVWFARLYGALGFDGASSHGGRRTFITKAAKRIVEAGVSLRDIQELTGHSSLATTQRYIQGDSRAKQNAVRMIQKAAEEGVNPCQRHQSRASYLSALRRLLAA
jgi:integrase